MTTKTRPTPRENVQAIAVEYASRAATAAARREAAVRARYEAQSAARRLISDAEAAEEAATTAATEAATLPGDLARALGWRGVNIVAEPSARDALATTYRAAFAHGRVVVGAIVRGSAPKARAYGWLHHHHGATDYDRTPPAGTNDPAKLEAQRHDAEINLRAWLAPHRAEVWLQAHGIDPETAPALVDIVSFGIEAKRIGHGHSNGDPAGVWHRPVWTMTLGGIEIARIEDARDILAPGEWQRHDEILGKIGGNGEHLFSDPSPWLSAEADAELVTAYAVRHIVRARAALLRQFTYQPDVDR